MRLDVGLHVHGQLRSWHRRGDHRLKQVAAIVGRENSEFRRDHEMNLDEKARSRTARSKVVVALGRQQFAVQNAS